MAEPLPIPTCPACGHQLQGRPLRGKCPNCSNNYALSLPGLEPGSVPRSSRYQKYQYAADLDRRTIYKAAGILLVGVGMVSMWKFSSPGPDEAVAYLIRYGITLACAFGLYLTLCLGVISFCGPLWRAALCIAGALAGADLAHHLVYSIGGWALLGVPWFVGFVVFTGLCADLLDLEITEAGIVAIITFAIRVGLKFALFDPMFAK